MRMVRIGHAESCGASGQSLSAGVPYQHMSLPGITSFVASRVRSTGSYGRQRCYRRTFGCQVGRRHSLPMLVPITVQPHASDSNQFTQAQSACSALYYRYRAHSHKKNTWAWCGSRFQCGIECQVYLDEAQPTGEVATLPRSLLADSSFPFCPFLWDDSACR
jgi:hypothetical protein